MDDVNFALFKKGEDKMKKYLISLLSVLTIFACLSCNAEAPISKVPAEVMECYELVNIFRTGEEAYYWNEDNTAIVNLVGKLDKLQLDDKLCKAAAIRAKEIVKEFSHTRPNGKKWSTVFGELKISYSACGENIAAGYSSGKATFNQWKEDGEKYIGQGHRRNMLSGDFTKIGIAFVAAPGSTYGYY